MLMGEEITDEVDKKQGQMPCLEEHFVFCLGLSSHRNETLMGFNLSPEPGVRSASTQNFLFFITNAELTPALDTTIFIDSYTYTFL